MPWLYILILHSNVTQHFASYFSMKPNCLQQRHNNLMWIFHLPWNLPNIVTNTVVLFMVARSPFNVIAYTVCAPKINLHYFCTFVWGVFHPLIRTSPLASPLLLLFYVCSVEMAASQDFLPKDLKIPCILTFVEETYSVVITLQNLFEGSRRGTSWSFLKWEYLVVLGVVAKEYFDDMIKLCSHATPF